MFDSQLRRKRRKLPKCLRRKPKSYTLDDPDYYRTQKKFSEMTGREKRDRLDYLRFRMRIIGTAIVFIHVLKKAVVKGDNARMKKFRLNFTKVSLDQVEPKKQIDYTQYVENCW